MLTWFDCVADTVRRTRYNDFWGEADSHYINTGRCGDFAADVIGDLEREYPFIDDAADNRGAYVEMGPGHFFVAATNETGRMRYYDAACLNGTQNVLLLPTYVRHDFSLARWNGCGWTRDYGAMARVPGLEQAIAGADPTELIL